MNSQNTVMLLSGAEGLQAIFDLWLKGVLLLATTAIGMLLLRQQSAAVRHLAWCAAISGMLLLPAISVVLPEWPVRFLPSLAANSSPSNLLEQGKQTAASSLGFGLEASQTAASGMIPFEQGSEPTRSGAEAVTPQASLYSESSNSASSGVFWIALIWSLGSALSAGPLIIGCIMMRGLTRRSQPVRDSHWLQLMKETSEELCIDRSVGLYHSTRLKIPVTWGFWRPVLILPSEALRWPRERLRMVLLHELAHIKRYDWLTQTIATVASSIYWINPLVWLACKRMRVEREFACDDCVLRAGARPDEYANELLRFASGTKNSGYLNWAAVPIARSSSLEQRLLAILEERRNRAALSQAFLVGASLLAILVLLPLAMVRAQTTPVEVHPQFGPVIQRTVFDWGGSQTNQSMLDLESGKLFSVSALEENESKALPDIAAIERALKRMRAEGIDLFGDTSGSTFNGLDMLMVATDEGFDQVTERQIATDGRLDGPVQTQVEVIVPVRFLRSSAASPSPLPPGVLTAEVPPTYLFKTRDGNRGVLQVLGFSNGRESMDFRYKLITPLRKQAGAQSPASKTVGSSVREPAPRERETAWLTAVSDTVANSVREADSSLVSQRSLVESRDMIYDTVYERELRPEPSRYLDLETGGFVETGPPGDISWSLLESDLRVRYGCRMTAIPVAPDMWESEPDDVLRKLRPALPQPEVRLGGRESEKTWFFKTDGGSAGVLQLLPHEKAEGSILIRYKLIRARRNFTRHNIVIPSLGKNRILSLEDLKMSPVISTNIPSLRIERRPELGWCAIVENGHNYSAEREQGKKLWESLSAEDISQPAGLAGLHFERTGIHPVREDRLPITVLIPQYGILQITAMVVDSAGCGAIIDYKQVNRIPTGR